MWTKRQALLGKGIAAIGLAVLLAASVLPRLISLYQRDWPDQGSRPLIILATQGGKLDYSVEVRSEIDSSGRFSFRFYLQGEELEEVATTRPFARFQVIVIGALSPGDLSCGGGSASADVIGVDRLDPGPSYAYEIDRLASRGSATHYGESKSAVASSAASSAQAPMPAASPVGGRSVDIDIHRYGGEMWGWHDDERVPGSRSVNSDGVIFVEECSLAPALVWSSTQPDDPMLGSEATLFAPQFNLTSIDGATDHQTGFNVRLWVDRLDGATIVRAYPAPATRASGWNLSYSVTWEGTLGAKRNLAYTDQPTWLMANRDSSRAEQTWLLFGGMGLGLGLTLLTRGISDLIDAAVRDDGQRSNRLHPRLWTRSNRRDDSQED